MLNAHPWLRDAWRLFQDRLRAGRLAHAILLQGPAGTGKTQLARTMAATLLCTEGAQRACGQCRSCTLFSSGAHPDWFLLTPEEGKHQILIEAVRDITRGLTLTATISARKVALISPAEAMNINAANALLKCLEEPPGETVILLVTHDAARLPVTIRSRCQAITIAMPERAVAIDWLRTAGELDEHTAAAALEASGGSPLRALHYAEHGRVADFEGLRQGLSGLLRSPRQLAALAAELGAMEPETLWYWLSTCVADALRSVSAGSPVKWLGQARVPEPARLSRLQQHADRNRVLARTAVRQDLLIEEWLIEWAGLAD